MLALVDSLFQNSKIKTLNLNSWTLFLKFLSNTTFRFYVETIIKYKKFKKIDSSVVLHENKIQFQNKLLSVTKVLNI